MPACGYNWKRAGSENFFDVRTSILLIISELTSGNNMLWVNFPFNPIWTGGGDIRPPKVFPP